MMLVAPICGEIIVLVQLLRIAYVWLHIYIYINNQINHFYYLPFYLFANIWWCVNPDWVISGWNGY